jgi:Zn-dependent alcohol dehydrogenase
VLGSVYGSSRPERDFPALLELYLRGRLPIDRLISARVPLSDIGRAFDALHEARGARFVLDLNEASA